MSYQDTVRKTLASFKNDGQLSRRRFLRSSAVALLSVTAMPLLATTRSQTDRVLSFNNLHTGEKLSATIWSEGIYQHDELDLVNDILRDHRTGDIHTMDTRLLDFLFALQETVNATGTFNIISGYRSPATNEKLRSASNGVAKKSFHMQGRAIDINLSGCDLSTLRDAAVSLQAGGVGFYPKSNFIHVDTGNIRSWG
ncbi:MAG: DUF882 domain-containing protein [Gammaproteobacteria bacterium]